MMDVVMVEVAVMIYYRVVVAVFSVLDFRESPKSIFWVK